MKITLQYFNDCPNWKKTDRQLREIISDNDVSATIEYQLIETQEDAEKYQFAGSPTLFFDGVDPFQPRLKTIGLACRVYLTDSGASEGPSKSQLREALGVTTE